MYERAGFALLRRRILLGQPPPSVTTECETELSCLMDPDPPPNMAAPGDLIRALVGAVEEPSRSHREAGR